MTSNKLSLKKLDFQKIAKYAAAATPLAIALVNVMAYLRQSYIDLLLGINLPPRIDQISIISLSISLVGVLSFIAIPIAYYFLKTHRPANRQIRIMNILIVLAALIGIFAATDLPIQIKLFDALSLFILLIILPLFLAVLLFGEDRHSLFTGDKITVIMKYIGLSIVIITSFLWMSIAKPAITSLNEPRKYNTIKLDGNSYVITDKEQGLFLVNELCRSKHVKRGSFRYVKVEDVKTINYEDFALKPGDC